MFALTLLLGGALAQDVDAKKTRADADAAEAAEVDGRKERPAGPDRSAPPEVAPAALLEQPEPTVHELRPGLVAWHVRVPNVRKVEVQVVPQIGVLDIADAADGTVDVMGWLMDAATPDMDSTEFEIFEDLNDLDVSSDIGVHDGTIGLSVPKDDLALGLQALGDVLRAPTFAGKDLKLRKREIAIWYNVLAAQSQSQVARSALTHAWYPPDHPYGARTDLDAIDGLKRSDLKAFHARWIGSAPVHVIVVGDLPWPKIAPKLTAALEGVGVEAAASEPRAFDPRPGRRVVAVDMPGQEQIAIQARFDAPHRTDDDMVAMYAGNWILGGHFLSRLNANLREDKGYTYGSRSSYWSDEARGSVTISVDVRSENAAEAVTEIRHELARLRDDGVTADELAAVHAASVSRWNDTRQTADSAMQFYRRLLERDHTVADSRAEIDAIGALSPEAVQAVAKAWLTDDTPQVWVMVGARDAIEAELGELGWEAEWTTPAAAIDGSFE